MTGEDPPTGDRGAEDQTRWAAAADGATEAPAPGSGTGADTRWAAMVRDHVGLALSVAYLTVTSVGLLFSWALYRRFGVNILEYADTSDFLMAAIRRPVSILVVAVAWPAVHAVIRMDRWTRRRYGWYEAIYRVRVLETLVYHPASQAVAFGLYALLFSQLYADRVADRIRAGGDQVVTVELAVDDPAVGSRQEPHHLIGTTGRFLFVYDPATESVEILPVENVLRIRPGRERSGARPAGDAPPATLPDGGAG